MQNDREIDCKHSILLYLFGVIIITALWDNLNILCRGDLQYHEWSEFCLA